MVQLRSANDPYPEGSCSHVEAGLGFDTAIAAAA